MKVKLKICTQCNSEKVIWKSIGKKDKYCKECWYKKEPPKKIAPINKKMKKVLDVYSKRRIAYLALNSLCEARLPGCFIKATEIHHKAGKIGELYTNISNFLAVCRNCHNYIENHSEEAKKLNLSQSRLNLKNETKTNDSSNC